MAILTSADYPAIRSAIDVSLTARQISDAIIEYPIFLDAAEAKVISRDPLALSRTGTDAMHIKNATIYYTAFFLIPSVPDIVRQSVGDYDYMRDPRDLEARGAQLLARAEAELAMVLTPTTTQLPRTKHFQTVAGRRG
jgi:hypothetical protein